MENAPEMTPEMYAELNVQQATRTEEQIPAQQVPMEDELASAKEALGLDKTEQTMSDMQNQMNTMMEDGLKQTMANKFPNIPYEIVEKEIAKVEAINPEFAASMRTTQQGMEMAYKTAQASITPKEKPDNLTDGESGGGQGEDIVETIRNGKANDFDLGDFIIGATK